ncbi:MAG: glycosyltransferase family 39 protein [candidate division Zixibacteria bacterium]|nr:glycosyltransferase family 39 protein [candidate division Zixibacteria bacterium]
MSKLTDSIASRPYLAVLAIGLVVRLVYLLYYIHGPEWDRLLVDSLFHHRWAMVIAGGDILGGEVFFRAPLYIYLLGLLYGIFGHAILVGRIFGHLVGLIAVLLTYQLADRLFTRRVAIVAGILHALYPLAVYFESELLVDSLFTMLTELSLLCLLIAGERKTIRWYFITGVVIGLAAITRPVILGLVPVYLIWILFDREKSAGYLRPIGAMILGMLLLIFPITIRNHAVGDDLVLISASGGVNFYIGNNPDADGLTAAMPPPLGANWRIQDITYLAEQDLGRELKPSEVSSYWTHQALHWITEHPGDFLRLYLKKLYYAANNYEVANNRNLRLFFDSNPVVKFIPLNFAVLVFLATIGVMLSFGNRRARLILLYLVWYLLTIAGFFINARFRLPILPLLMILAANGAVGLVQFAMKRQHITRHIAAIVAGVLLVLLSCSNWYHYHADDSSGGLFNQANYDLAHGQTDEAIARYKHILSEYPDYPEAALNCGAAYLKTGNGDSAMAYFRRELESFPANARALSNIASLYYVQGQFDSARYYAEAAIRSTPYLVDPYLVGLRTAAAVDDTSAFHAMLQRAEKSVFNPIRMYLDAGMIFSEWQMPDSAELYLRRVLEADNPAPETDDAAFDWTTAATGADSDALKARAAYQLGYLLGRQNRLNESIAMSARAIALDSGLIEAYVNLASGYLAADQRANARRIVDLAQRRFPGNALIAELARRIP